MVTPSASVVRSPAAIGAIAVAILLLLALSVLALRGGDRTTVTLDGDSEDPAATPAASASDADEPTDVDVPASDVPTGRPSAAETPSEELVPVARPSDAEVDSEGDGAVPSDPDGGTDAPAGTDGTGLTPGTCVVDDGRSSDVTSVAVIDCDVEHTGEVFAVTVVARPADAPYPGADALAEESRLLCQGSAFADYVGTPYDDSGLFAYALLPTETTWGAGDRAVACVLYDITGPLVGSMRDSG